jgi:hypothetical protein
MRRALFVLAVCPLWTTCTVSPSGSTANGYWSVSCLSGDARYLLAGGDHAALVDLSNGSIVATVPGMVEAVGCEEGGGVVVGYGSAMRLPGKAPAMPAPALPRDTVLGLAPDGAWISAGRRGSSKWRGPATVSVTEKGATRSMDLLPERFGAVGAARALPTADSFAVRWGNFLQDGRLVVVAGWEPSSAGDVFEKVPWGFFALNPRTGEASPLTGPVESDRRLNQAWQQKIGATPDGSRLLMAAHDGKEVSIAQFERGADRPARVTSLAAKGSPSAAAVSADGTFAAVATETRGRDAPAKVWVIDRAGKQVWAGEFQKNVAGLHFLPDGSLVVAAGEAKAVRVTLPAGTERWRTETARH